jgi:inosine triphosphate pyrophosphatase
MTHPLQFITGNEHKFRQFEEILGTDIPLERVSMDLDEIQSLDPREVVAHKLREAEKHASGTYIVEDSSFMLDALGGQLPGPFVKWFWDALGNEEVYALVEKLGNDHGRAVNIIGYIAPGEGPLFFQGEVHGRVVAPRGDKDFGFGPIFLPDGSDKTFGELEGVEKYTISPRGMAVRQLRDFLLSR